jgi:hypothetical protein
MPTLDQLLFLAERNSWQDLALCAGNVFFCFTLVPMLRHPATWTVGPTGAAGSGARANSPLLPLDSAEAPASSYRDISDLFRINAAISGWQFCRAGQQDRTYGLGHDGARTTLQGAEIYQIPVPSTG